MSQHTIISNDPTDTKIWKDISSGKYRHCYLVYNRKSTDDTENQKNSIKFQTSENVRFAFREHFPIAQITLTGFATDGIISERHSGFKEGGELTFGEGNTVRYRVDRPKFYRLFQFLSRNYFKGVIFLCWDRASRNKGDDTIIRKLMRAGVDIRFTLAKYDKTSAGELHMDVDGMFAEHHSRVTREKVTLTMNRERAKGVCTYKAPVGYLNQGNMNHKPFDPVRAPLIKQLFEKAATGAWSLADLARFAIEQNFTMPPVRRRRTHEEILAEEDDDVRLEIKAVPRLPTFNNIHKILTNRFYAGTILGNDGDWIKSTSHERLISDELFNEVQKQLNKKNKSAHYVKHLEHPLRGVVRCGICKRVYTPYTQKGITYYGARCSKDCPNRTKSFNFAFITTKVGALIGSLSFRDDELEEIDARAGTDIALLDAKRINQIEVNDCLKKKIREDLAYLNANRLMLLKTGAYTPEKLVEDEANLNLELSTLSGEEIASDISMQDTVRDVVNLSELLKKAVPHYSFAEPQQKDKIIRTIFSELTFSENTLDYKCKKGFEVLSSRFIPKCDPTGWLSETLLNTNSVKEALDDLSEFLIGAPP